MSTCENKVNPDWDTFVSMLIDRDVPGYARRSQQESDQFMFLEALAEADSSSWPDSHDEELWATLPPSEDEESESAEEP